MAKKSRSDRPHDYGPTIGCGPFARPTYPHPDSPMGRAILRKPLSHFQGTGPDIKGVLRLKAAAPIMAPKPQKPCDIGLFSDEADQLDLVEMFMDSTEEE